MLSTEQRQQLLAMFASRTTYSLFYCSLKQELSLSRAALSPLSRCSAFSMGAIGSIPKRLGREELSTYEEYGLAWR